MSTVLFLVPMLVLFSGLFLASRDLVQKQLALFIASYLAFVVFSEFFFGMQFSRKSNIGNIDIDAVSPTLALFWASFYFASQVKLGRVAIEAPPLRHPGGRATSLTTILLALPLIVFFTYFIARNGIRVTGAFVDFRGERSTLTDYMFVYYASLLSYYRNSRLLLAIGIAAAASHMLSAERLRAFVYIIVILINYFGIDTRRNTSSAVFLCGFFVATIIGSMRTGNMGIERDYNVTHFGSVTVSSLYLLDFGSTIDVWQKIQFLLGTFVSNLIPSSMVPEAYNVRKAILTFATIPGGGWFPVFLKVQSGFVGILAGGLIVGKLYGWALRKTRGRSVMQPAYYAAILVFIATAPRWFMYTPYQILKMPLYAFVLTTLLIVLSKLTAKRRQSHGA